MNTKQIAKYLGVSQQTIRNWLATGDEFFSPGATSSARKRYYQFDLDQFQTIKKLTGDGVKLNELANHLQPAPQNQSFKEIDVDPSQVSDDTAIAPADYFQKMFQESEERRKQIEAAYQEYMDRIDKEHKNTIDAKDDAIKELKEDKQRLLSELEEARKPFFKRWFGD